MTLATEHNLTVAVDAAARAAYESRRAEMIQRGEISLAWEQADPILKNMWRQASLPIVMAALEVLPDPRHAAWEEGHLSHINARNPYPSGL